MELLKKMIRNCFLQYQHDAESIPLTEEEYKHLCQKIIKAKEQVRDSDIYELVQDVVYEYLTK
jgi:YqzH-like protein